MGRIIGIDLGTTNSCAAIMDGGNAQIIPNKMGGRTTPSMVAFTPKGERLVGQLAKHQMVTNAGSTVFAVKRLMGRKYDNPNVMQAAAFLPYRLQPSDRGDVRVVIGEHSYSPPEISAFILQYIKATAEGFLGEEIHEAILTVPAYFDDAQRQATKDAGRIAGLEVQRIINEPTAAALAYGFGKNCSEKIVIYDLGGGTFDVSILELSNGVYEVLATDGDTFLGGEDIDQRIIEWMMNSFREETGIDLRSDLVALQRMKEAAERAKCDLSQVMETQVSLPFLVSEKDEVRHFDRRLTRSFLEEITIPIIERTVGPCITALECAKLRIDQIDKVILVGGQTRMPLVSTWVQKIFGHSPSAEINPDEVVAIGAAIQGNVLKGNIRDIVLLDVTSLSLGVETQGGLFTKLIPRNSTIPLREAAVFTTVTDNQSTVTIHVLQGERDIARFNRSLAHFDLTGIAAAPKGTPQIEVSFDVDVNGILNVSAQDKQSGKEQTLRITPSSGLARDEIEHMIQESKDYLEADRIQKELTQTRNRIRELASSISKSYNEFAWVLNPEEQSRIKRDLAAANRIAEVPENRTDLDRYKKLLKSLIEETALLQHSLYGLADEGMKLSSLQPTAPDSPSSSEGEPGKKG